MNFYFLSPWAAVETAETADEFPIRIAHNTVSVKEPGPFTEGKENCDTSLRNLASKVEAFINENASISFEVRCWMEDRQIWCDKK